jgi:hypothetical protein
MCTICWTSEFCWDETNPADPWYPSINGACPNGGKLAAPASRVADAFGRETGFYCLESAGKTVNHAGGIGCPSDDPTRQTVEHIDVCVDLPSCAHPPECGSDPESACPEVEPDPRPEVCVDVPDYDPEADWSLNAERGAQAVANALVATCARHGTMVPQEQPGRYCFLACISPRTCDYDTLPYKECDGCNWFTPAQHAASVFPVESTANLGSSVEIAAKDAEGEFQPVGSLPIEGAFRLSVPADCHGGAAVVAECEGVLRSVALHSSGTLNVEDESITNVRLVDNAPLVDVLVTQGFESIMSVTSLSFGVTADATSQPYAYSSFEPEGALDVAISWGTGTVQLTSTLLSTDGNFKLVFNVFGTFGSLPPVAVATAATPVECGHDPIGLDAAYSHDPDGPSDIVGYSWAADLGAAGLWSASGVAPTLWHRKPGTYRFYLTVTDTVSSHSIDFVDVELVDSLPPELDVGPDIYLEACGPSPIPFFDVVLDDDCDTEPTLDIRIREVNGVPADIPYTPNETRLPLGRTLLEYRAYDDMGNTAVGLQAVYLEPGLTCCPIGATQFFGTSGDDTLTGDATGVSCLVGYDGADGLYGGGSVVTFFGGLGDDEIHDSSGKVELAWGGLGDDDFYISGPYVAGETHISGGAGNDVVIYSGDRPVRIRGGAGMDDLNSTTTDVTTFVLGAACEAVAGEVWQSYGPTVVESPISIDALQVLGVILALGEPVTYVETDVLHDAECF